MRKLSELGISPAPWKCVKAINAECGRSLIVRSCKGGELPTLLPQNARLIAASPKLYAEQYHDCVALRAVVTKLDEGMEVLNLRDILAEMADRMEAVLAEAAGEGANNGK